MQLSARLDIKTDSYSLRCLIAPVLGGMGWGVGGGCHTFHYREETLEAKLCRLQILLCFLCLEVCNCIAFLLHRRAEDGDIGQSVCQTL